MIIEMAISMENGSVCVFNDAIRCYTKYIHIFLNYGTVTEVKIRFANERARSKPLNRKTLPNNEQKIKKNATQEPASPRSGKRFVRLRKWMRFTGLVGSTVFFGRAAGAGNHVEEPRHKTVDDRKPTECTIGARNKEKTPILFGSSCFEEKCRLKACRQHNRRGC